MEISMSNFLQNQKGQAVAEFAIILPILFLLIFGIINFGMYIHARYIVTVAATEGARVGSLFNENTKIRGIIVNNIKSNLKYEESLLNIALTPIDNRKVGDELKVDVEYLLSLPINFNFENLDIPIFSSKGVKVKASVITTVESDQTGEV